MSDATDGSAESGSAGSGYRGLSPGDRASLVERLSTDTAIGSLVAGTYDNSNVPNAKPGIYVQALSNLPESFIKLGSNPSLTDSLYVKLFRGRNKCREEFLARVIGEPLKPSSFSYSFLLAFNDNQGMDRRGQYTGFHIFIPPEQVEEVVPQINADPSVLLDVFKNLYPDHDRSACLETTITMDTSEQGFIDGYGGHADLNKQSAYAASSETTQYGAGEDSGCVIPAIVGLVAIDQLLIRGATYLFTEESRTVLGMTLEIIGSFF